MAISSRTCPAVNLQFVSLVKSIHTIGKCVMRHYVHDYLNRLRIVTFCKKAAKFRDYVSIFVHANVCYICLFSNTNIMIINETYMFLEDFNLGFFRFLTCES